MSEPRFKKCPKCGGPDIEILGESYWTCWDCDWEEELNQEEKDNYEQG